MTQLPHSLDILGTDVNAFHSPGHAARVVKTRIDSGRSTFCVAINPEKVYRARHDANLQAVLNSANVRICDGVGVSLAARLLHGVRLPRCTGVDLFIRLIGLAAEEGWKVFLLGGSSDSIAGARRSLSTSFPTLNIVGSQHGFFEDAAKVVDDINRSEAVLLFVAMGSPRQEMWIYEHMPHLRPKLFMGVGGSLDILSGAATRAPLFCRKTGTEWLYRLLTDPRRIRRQLALPLFALRVLGDVYKRPFGRVRASAEGRR